MYRVFVNNSDNPEYYVKVRDVSDPVFGVGYVEAGNDEAFIFYRSDHYILVETDEDIKQIPTTDVWENKVKILHPDVQS